MTPQASLNDVLSGLGRVAAMSVGNAGPMVYLIRENPLVAESVDENVAMSKALWAAGLVELVGVEGYDYLEEGSIELVEGCLTNHPRFAVKMEEFCPGAVHGLDSKLLHDEIELSIEEGEFSGHFDDHPDQVLRPGILFKNCVHLRERLGCRGGVVVNASSRQVDGFVALAESATPPVPYVVLEGLHYTAHSADARSRVA